MEKGIINTALPLANWEICWVRLLLLWLEILPLCSTKFGHFASYAETVLIGIDTINFNNEDLILIKNQQMISPTVSPSEAATVMSYFCDKLEQTESYYYSKIHYEVEQKNGTTSPYLGLLFKLMEVRWFQHLEKKC